MPIKSIPFERWNSQESVSWPFRVFQKHNKELTLMYVSHIASKEFVYRTLGANNASWNDDVCSYFRFDDEISERSFKDLKSWSNSFNDFDNWINLNSIMAMSSNLETYMSTVIKLALESDIGVLFGASRKIDGIKVLKHGKTQPFDFEDKLTSCTKGDWNSRVKAFESIFGNVPLLIKENISKLERLRVLRNNVGHAFGRDIKESRNHDVIDISKMNKIDRDKTITYQKLLFGISKQIDKQLITNHIGDYQPLYFYHNLRPRLSQNDPVKNREIGNHVAILKKNLGRFGAKILSKKYFKELIQYYESL